jgi:MoaA/NifB/PqqE/SkfB family radical SAM enzyme
VTTTVTTGGSSRHELVRLAGQGQPLPSPVEAYFEVANRCNSKCATCPLTFSPQENTKQLSLEEFKILVDQLPDLRRAVMQGIGEPLLNRELAPMIRHLKQRGVYVVFNTNAALLTRRRQVELIESGLDELRVSVDGSTPETYLKVRGIPAFHRVVGNVAEMVRTQRELGSSTPRLSLWVTGIRENLSELPDVIDLAARIGVGEVYLQRMVFGFSDDGVGKTLARARTRAFMTSGISRRRKLLSTRRSDARTRTAYGFVEPTHSARGKALSIGRQWLSRGAPVAARCDWRT